MLYQIIPHTISARSRIIIHTPTTYSYYHGTIEFNGLMIDPSAGIVHHLSYVRTTHQLIHQKLASFAHSQVIQCLYGHHLYISLSNASISIILHPFHLFYCLFV